MAAKVDQGFCVFAAGSLIKRIGDLRQEIDGVRVGEDIEFIHRMRVASRRLRSGLSVFGECIQAKQFPAWQKKVKGITRALGAARDTDVQLETLGRYALSVDDPRHQPGLKRLTLRLQQQRAREQQRVLEALDAIQSSKVLDLIEGQLQPYLELSGQIYVYTPYLYQQSFSHISNNLNDFLGYDEFVTQPERVAELHAMRIAAKSLRYTMEIFAPLYPGELKKYINTVKSIQEQLGDIHDSDVWILGLPQFLEAERKRMLDYFGHSRSFRRLVIGVTGFEDDRKRYRDALYKKFVDYWGILKVKDFWADMRHILQMPPRFQAIEPPPEEPKPPDEATT